ncbi:MAG: hypothetical protein U1D30_21830 [Planctomycetota bacterium]
MNRTFKSVSRFPKTGIPAPYDPTSIAKHPIHLKIQDAIGEPYRWCSANTNENLLTVIVYSTLAGILIANPAFLGSERRILESTVRLAGRYLIPSP